MNKEQLDEMCRLYAEDEERKRRPLPTVRINATIDQFIAVMTGNMIRHDGSRFVSMKDVETLHDWRVLCRRLDEKHRKAKT